MQFVRKNKEIETLVSIFTLLKIAQLLQARLQSFWLELVTNFRKDFSEKSTEEVDFLRWGSSQSVEWSMRTTEGLLELDYWTLQMLLTRSEPEIVLLNTQSTRLSNANERKLLSFRTLTDEQTDLVVVENNCRNQTFISFFNRYDRKTRRAP